MATPHEPNPNGAFGDMNGNTTTDVVWVMNDGKIKYLDMMIAPYMGLLTKVIMAWAQSPP